MSDGAVKRKSSAASHFAAGLGSGVVSACLLQPADLLKTRVQQTQAASLRSALRDVLRRPNPVRELWRGTTPSIIRTGCGSALYFGLLHQMRQHAARMPDGAFPVVSPSSNSASTSALPKLSNAANLTTGALARVAAGFCLNPVTVLKVRYESSQYAYTSMARAAGDILRREGPRGFFAGFGVTAVRDAPYAGLYVVLYEQAKVWLGELVAARREAVAALAGGAGMQSHNTSGVVGSAVTVNFVSGAIAATSATALTNPFDAVKTRLQLRPNHYRNMFRAARLMLRDEGIKSMFRGLSLRVGRKAISSALTWTVYEEAIRRVEKALV